MSDDSNKQELEALESAIGEKQSMVFDSHNEVIQYVREVKEALNVLVEKVVKDQEATSKLFEETKHEIEDVRGHLVEGVVGDNDTNGGALVDRVAELEETTAKYESKIESYKQKLEHSKKQLRDQAGLTEDNEAHVERKSELEDRLLEMTQEKDALDRKVGNLESKLTEHAKASEKVSALEAETERLRAEATDMSAAMEASRAAAETNLGDVNAARGELENVQAQVKAYKAEVDAMTEAAAQHNFAVKQLEEQHAEEKARIEVDHAHALGELQEQKIALEARIAGTGEREAKLESEFAEAQDQIAEVGRQLEEEKSKTVALGSDLRSRAESNVGHVKDSSEFSERIALLEQTTESNVQTITGLKDELKGANENADKAGERLEELRSHAKKTMESEQEKSLALGKAESDLAVMQEDAGARAILKEKANELEAQMVVLRNRNAAVEEELAAEKAKGSKSALATQLAEALHETEEYQEEVQTLHTEIEELKKKKVAEEAPRVIMEFDEDAAKHRLGDMLLETGVITAEQLDEVLQEHKEGVDHGRIGQAFVDKGFATEDVVVQALAAQTEIPFFRIKKNSIGHDALRLVSERLAEKHNCIPIRIEDGELVVAMENPMDLIAIEDLERISDLTVKPLMSTPTEIREAIELHFGER